MVNGNSQSLCWIISVEISIWGALVANIWLNVARRIGSVITKGHTTLIFCPITMIDVLLTGINESYKPCTLLVLGNSFTWRECS